jgi:hypothetical protein
VCPSPPSSLPNLLRPHFELWCTSAIFRILLNLHKGIKEVQSNEGQAS